MHPMARKDPHVRRVQDHEYSTFILCQRTGREQINWEMRKQQGEKKDPAYF